MIDLVLRGGRVATPGGILEADLAIAEGRIAAIGRMSITMFNSRLSRIT